MGARYWQMVGFLSLAWGNKMSNRVKNRSNRCFSLLFARIRPVRKKILFFMSKENHNDFWYELSPQRYLVW